MEAITPPGAFVPEIPLSLGVRAGDYLFVSGQVGQAEDGSWRTGGSFEDEVKATLDNVARIVRRAGGTLENVCKVTAYLVEAELFEAYNRVYAEYFSPPWPARSTVCCALVRPELRIEVEAIVWLGS